MRRQRSSLAVPASKLKWGVVYAMRHPETKELIRVKITSVNTKRRGPSPKDVTSKVDVAIYSEPYFSMRRAGIHANDAAFLDDVDPDLILGPYEEYTELVERQAEERKAKRAEEREEARLKFLAHRAMVAAGFPMGDLDTMRVGSLSLTDSKPETLKQVIKLLDGDIHEPVERATLREIFDPHGRMESTWGDE